jgi:hypothetical protein
MIIMSPSTSSQGITLTVDPNLASVVHAFACRTTTKLSLRSCTVRVYIHDNHYLCLVQNLIDYPTNIIIIYLNCFLFLIYSGLAQARPNQSVTWPNTQIYMHKSFTSTTAVCVHTMQCNKIQFQRMYTDMYSIYTCKLQVARFLIWQFGELGIECHTKTHQFNSMHARLWR